jgi:hypothetical protein
MWVGFNNLRSLGKSIAFRALFLAFALFLGTNSGVMLFLSEFESNPTELMEKFSEEKKDIEKEELEIDDFIPDFFHYFFQHNDCGLSPNIICRISANHFLDIATPPPKNC